MGHGKKWEMKVNIINLSLWINLPARMKYKNTSIPRKKRFHGTLGFVLFPFVRFSEHWRGKESFINQCFFSPSLSVFLWDGYSIKISVLSQTCSVVSTPEIFCWLSLFVKSMLETWESWAMAGTRRQIEEPSTGAQTSEEMHLCSSSTAQISVSLALQCQSKAGCRDGCCRGCFRIPPSQWDAAVPKAEGAALSSVPGREQQCTQSFICLVLCCKHGASWPASRLGGYFQRDLPTYTIPWFEKSS